MSSSNQVSQSRKRRKSLQTLQQSTHAKVLSGRNENATEIQKSDGPPSKTLKTDPVNRQQTIKNWLIQPKVEDPGYWKELAEERKLALEKTLTENEELHLKIEMLKAENSHLKKLADKAVHLTEILETAGIDVDDALSD